MTRQRCSCQKLLEVLEVRGPVLKNRFLERTFSSFAVLEKEKPGGSPISKCHVGFPEKEKLLRPNVNAPQKAP